VVDGALDHAALRARHHALRQPLNALVLLTEALKLQSVSPPADASSQSGQQGFQARQAQQARLLEGIAEAAQSVERLIDALFTELQALAPPVPADASWGATQVQPREPVAAFDGVSPATGTLVGASAGPQPSPSADPGASPAAGPSAWSPSIPPSGSTSPPTSPPSAASLAGSAAGPAAGRRIVVVDDDDTTRVGLAMLLEALGAQTVGLGSIQALQDWLQAGPGPRPDLAVIDYHLPRPGQGLEALRMLRRTWPMPPLRVLLITGDDRAAMSNALTDGSFDYLLKPVKPHELRAALQRQLGV
jgi:CheY-like chemotaxis protein